MTQEPQKSNVVLIVIAIIGVIGTIVATTIGVIGNYNIEKLRQDTELTRIALVSIATQGGATQISMASTISAPTDTPYPTDTPLPMPTNTFISPATSTPITCPSSHLGAGKQFNITLQGDCYYHFNIACDGCVAGQENNYLIYYSGNSFQVTVPEGSVWQYGNEPTINQFSSDCATSSIDFWPAQLPSFLSISGVRQIWPCGVK